MNRTRKSLHDNAKKIEHEQNGQRKIGVELGYNTIY